MDLKIILINLKTVLVVGLLIALVDESHGRTYPYARAQLIEPKWNWEEVILSRNGPSTTTPPPTTTYIILFICSLHKTYIPTIWGSFTKHVDLYLEIFDTPSPILFY